VLPAPGTTIGRYVVFDLLGRGAMGAVFRAWDDLLDRIVALKILLPNAALRPDAHARFLREARLAARINHPAVAHVYDVGQHEDTPFIAMEFVPGRQLRADIGEPTPGDRAVFLARQILGGLAEAHRQGVIHRDLKPENILLSGRDQVKLLDFGLAKAMVHDPRDALPPTVGLAGTPRYMAPEQLSNKDVDRRTDIYALGAVLYELLTGQPAHPGDNFIDIARSILEGPPVTLEHTRATPVLVESVERAMEREPARRFESAEEMLAALSTIRGESQYGPAPSLREAYLPHPRAEVFTRRAREQLVGFGTSNAEVALELATQAVTLDPDYPRAHAVLAEAAASAYAPKPTEVRLLDLAERHLQAAERLDPALPDLRVARAKLLWNKTFNFPAETALRELTLALRVDPGHVGALRLWASVTAHLGLSDLLRPAIERRLADDKNDGFMRVLEVGIALQENRPRDALTLLAPVLRLDPKHEESVPWWLAAHAHLHLGDLDDATAALEGALERKPEEPGLLAMLALADALSGDEQSARAIAEQALRSTEAEAHPHHAYHHLALTFSVLGDMPAALSWLRRTAEEGFPCLPWFENEPFLANVRATEEGAAYLRELGRRHTFFRREFGVVAWLRRS
jgi:tetratricopeptide (TPR) repeat protein